MIRLSFSILVLALLCVVRSAGAAQHKHEPAGTAPERLGTVKFQTTCKPEVQADFNRGVALLHSFWFGAATDAFGKVAAADPSCAMAYWGVAMTHWGNPFGSFRSPAGLAAGRAAWEKGSAAAAEHSPRERAYVAAIGELFKDAATVDQRTRVLAYEKAMAALVAAWPDDIEAKIFYAVALDQAALPSDKSYKNQLAAAAILEPFARDLPDHPGIAHYLIHTYDSPALAARGLEAARRYAAIAPGVPHALHMPSHTFTRVGSWQESVDTNLASAKAARREGSAIEELHALDYQTYAYLQLARDAAVGGVLGQLDALAALIPTARPDAAPIPAGYYALAAIPARFALERGDWKAAAALPVRQSAFPWTDAITHFARAVGAGRAGQPQAVRAEVARLSEIRDALRQKNEAYWSEQVEIQRRAAEGWALFGEGQREEGLALLGTAADLEDTTEKAPVTPGPLVPARELLGEMFLEAGRPGEALVAFEATVLKEPNRFRGVHGAARAAERTGDRAKAARYYNQLVTLGVGADQPPRPALAEARKFVTKSNE